MIRSNMLSRSAVLSRRIFNITPRFLSEGQSQSPSSSSASSPQSSVNANVPGLSSAVVHNATEPLGPGVEPNKTGAYKVPEYFCYDNMSYFEAEIEMSKFRCPQPSAVKK